MTGIQVALLQRGSKRYTQEGKNNAGLLVGDIRVKDAARTLRGFVKICHSDAQLHAELVSAVLGRFLGLEIPEPFIVVITPEANPPLDTKLTYPIIGFGTAAVAGHSFARLGNFEALLDQLKNLGQIAAFDQLMANGDRHLAQMLYDGKTCSPIDHAQSFGGDSWSVMGLPSPSIDILNWLLERSAYGEKLAKDDVARYTLRKKANASFLPLSGNVAQVLRDGGAAQAINEETLRSLYNWLESRISHAVVQLCQKIGLPDMGYAVTSSTSFQSGQP